MKAYLRNMLLFALAAAPLLAHAVPVVHRTDIIADNQRTHFAGFETLTDRVSFDMKHSEDGILVQNLGDNLVWTEHWFRSGFEGGRSWYPSGTYTGYNVIKREDGADFDAVGMLVGSGFGGYCNWDFDNCDAGSQYLRLYYELRQDGILIGSGMLDHHANARYLGFSGGGFDEIRLWDRHVYDPERSALMLDAIELGSQATAVPEPGTAALLAGALGLMGAMRRRRS